MIGPNPKIIVLQGGQPEAFADPVVGNAVHSNGGLSIKIYGGLPDFTGVLAQEWDEIARERLQGLCGAALAVILASVILALFHTPFGFILLADVVALVAGFVFASGYSPESAEVASHALTARVNVKYDNIPAATAEAWGADSLSKYSWAHGEDAASLIKKMQAAYPQADQKIAANDALYQGWQKIRLPVRGPQ